MTHYLLINGERSCEVIIADSFIGRLRGLLFRRSLKGAMYFPNVKSVHTIGMWFSIDVVSIDLNNKVIGVETLSPNRFSRTIKGAISILEFESGYVKHNGIKIGDEIEIVED